MICANCNVLSEMNDRRAKEIADLKQQLHAYRELHDARDAYAQCNASFEWQFSSMGRAQIERIEKANAELQSLRNAKK